MTIGNVAVCVAAGDQTSLHVIPDGQGGSIVLWSDGRDGEFDVYAQRIDASGAAKWAADGVPVCKAAGAQAAPRAVPDGSGGAFVVWQDGRSGGLDIYAQRLGPAGATLWPNGGAMVCAAIGDQREPAITTDGGSGAFVAWFDERSGGTAVYAQRIAATGTTTWVDGGTPICAASGTRKNLDIAPDGLSGAVMVWEDARDDAGDIYAARVDGAGNALWSADGSPAAVRAGIQERPRSIYDGLGGVLVVWVDSGGASRDIYAQRLGADGQAQWDASGVALCQATGDQSAPQPCPDGSGGLIAVWEDRRGGNADLYAQRVAVTGTAVWAVDGVPVVTAAAEQFGAAIVAEPNGGATVAWSDARSAASGADIYVQHLSPAGGLSWSPGGVLLCNATGDQTSAALTATGQGGITVFWRDPRAGTPDLYGQVVTPGGQVPDQCTPPVELVSDAPVAVGAPESHFAFGQLDFYWTAVGVRSPVGSDWDLTLFAPGDPATEAYPICFANPLAGSFASTGVDFVIGNANLGHLPLGTYNLRASRFAGSAAATLEWDAGADEAVKDAQNSGARRNNWTGVIDVYDLYLFAGRTYTFEFNHSGSGQVKLLLFSSRGGPAAYLVPRSAALFDTDHRFTTFDVPSQEWYGLTIVNENGAPATYDVKVWSPQNTPIGVEGPAPARSELAGFSPNPSRGEVRIRFALDREAEVSFQAFDMAGRRVGSPPGGRWSAGYWSVTWDGRGSAGEWLSSGLYFVEMRVDGKAVGRSRVALLH